MIKSTKKDKLASLPTDKREVIYSVNQLAQVLGTTPGAIKKRIARGLIPAHREGRRLLILKSEYVSCLQNRSL